MTLLELLDTSCCASLLHVYLRGNKRSESQLVQIYHIGTRAECFAGETEGAATGENDCTYKAIVINKPIHVQDDGAASYQVGLVKKSIPKALLDAEVTRWSCNNEYGAPINHALEFHVDVFSGTGTAEAERQRIIAECEAKAAKAEELKIDFGGE